MRPIDYIVVHCAFTSADMDIGVREIDRWHRARGFLSCGYHYVIRRNGIEEVGRPVTQAGAHAKGFNRNSIGICLVGGKDTDGSPVNNFTPEQDRALAVMLRTLQRSWPHAQIVGHRQLNPHKDCPCFDVQEWLQTHNF